MSILSKTLEPSPKVKTEEPLKSHAEVSAFLSKIINVCLHGLVLLLPLLFTPWTLDSLEMGKQTLLVVLVSIALIAWLGKAIADKSFTLIRHWIHLVVLLFGVGYLLVSLFSQDAYLSFVGAFGQMPWSFATVLSLIVLYFVIVHHVRKTSQVYNLVLTFLVSSFLVAFYGLLQIFGLHVLNAPIAQNRGFSTVGSVFSLAVFLVVPVTIAASLLFHGCRNKVCYLGSSKPIGIASRILLWGVLVVGLMDLILIDYWSAWLGLSFGVVVTVLIGFLRSKRVNHSVSMIAPVAILLISILFLFIQSPIHTSVPGEVSPSFRASWDIATRSLEQNPLTGSGPGTWIYDYAQHRVQEINLSPFWQVRFDRAFSFFLTLVATTGLLGVILWLFLIISAIAKSVKCLLQEKDDDIWYAYLIVFTGWLTLVFMTFFYNLNMPHLFALWLLLALLGAVVSRNSITWEAKKNPLTYGALSTAFVVIVVAGISVSWLAGQRYTAELVFTDAVQQHRSGAGIDKVLPKVTRAASLNALSDVYARNLSQAHLLKAVRLIEEDPSLSDPIQRQLKAAVDNARHATELAPANIDNWTNLGLIYENLASFTRGADEESIKAFQRAHELEPQNPVILTEIGKLYLLRADAHRTNLDNPERDQEEVRANIEENLDFAEAHLRDAIDAKPDYLPSRYYLGIVFERGGNVQNAIGELENVLRLNNRDVGVAFELSILYYRNNQKQESLNLMEQVVNIVPDNANAKWYLSAMYEEQGRTEDAVSVLESLAEQFPDNAAVQQRLNALRSPAEQPPAEEALPLPIERDISGPEENNPIQQ